MKNNLQWRIQDFPEEGASTPKVGVQTYYFDQFSPKTAWKWKKKWTQRGRTSLAPPLDLSMIYALFLSVWLILEINQKNYTQETSLYFQIYWRLVKLRFNWCKCQNVLGKSWIFWHFVDWSSAYCLLVTWRSCFGFRKAIIHYRSWWWEPMPEYLSAKRILPDCWLVLVVGIHTWMLSVQMPGCWILSGDRNPHLNVLVQKGLYV